MDARRGRIVVVVAAFAILLGWLLFRPAVVGDDSHRAGGRAEWKGTLGAETPGDPPPPLPKRSANPAGTSAGAAVVPQGTGAIAAGSGDGAMTPDVRTASTPSPGSAAGAGGAGLATIRVTTLFDGTPPTAKRLSVEADPFCAKSGELYDEEIAVKNGALANVFVRILHGPKGERTAFREITQTGCRYRPRVVGLIAGEDLKIRSNDDTTHNVHTYDGERSIFNRAQNKGEFTKKSADLRVEDGPVTLKCDIHPWMTGTVFVTDTPFFAVTDETGSAMISAPPGHYTLQAWHEKYGFSTAEVTVTAGISSDVQFRIGPRPR